jgi:hypothetical protein
VGTATAQPGLWEEPTQWRVSAAWATKPYECTLRGIMTRCGGHCCHSKVFWPPTSGNQGGPGGCHWLGAEGCLLGPDKRPVTCLIYPLKLNKAGTLVIHHKAVVNKTLCSGNYGAPDAPMLIDAIAEHMVALFGQQQYDRVRADVVAGRDSYFDVPPHVLAAYEQEERWAAANEIPRPRGHKEEA